jgi:AcrR family transcriptional regulator
MKATKQRGYRKPEKAKAMLVACSKLVGGKGYAEVSMKDIANEAGVQQSLLHYYFKSKDNLFLELFRFLKRKYLDIMSEVLSRPASIDEKLDAGFKTFQKFSREEPKWMLMIMDIIIQGVHKPESKAEILSTFNEVARITKEELRKDKETDIAGNRLDEEALSTLLIATMTGLGILSTIDDQATDYSKAWAYFSRMFTGFVQEPGVRQEDGKEGKQL